MASKQAVTWLNKKRRVDGLKDHPQNPRTFTDSGMAALRRSIETCGYVEPIAINTDGTILSGHARKQILLDLGLETIDVRMPSRPLTDEECREVLIRMNANEAGEWSFDGLDWDKDELAGFDFDFDFADVFQDEPVKPALDLSKIESLVKSGDEFRLGEHRLLCGDAAEVLAAMDPESIDSLVTDPPAGIAFMGKEWDEDKGGRDEWIAWLTGIMQSVYRALKPGAHGFVWALPRTSHWTATACENAGFEIRDKAMHLFGSGFPKSHDISKGIDREAGAERPRGAPQKRLNASPSINSGGGFGSPEWSAQTKEAQTKEAQTWQGWGTALKPAYEEWILIRKPLSESTIAKNVLKHGTGGLNIDATRIEHADAADACKQDHSESSSKGNGTFDPLSGSTTFKRGGGSTLGRWPSNVFLSHHPECNGTCVEGCPVAELDRQSGVRKSGAQKTHVQKNRDSYSGSMPAIRYVDNEASTGFASRFFYVAKPSTREKEAGLAEAGRSTMGAFPNDPSPSKAAGEVRARNVHPTVKPLALMRQLVRLITPPGGTVLDPFAGSGTTLCAAQQEGFDSIGIEREPEYMEIAKARLNGLLPDFEGQPNEEEFQAEA